MFETHGVNNLKNGIVITKWFVLVEYRYSVVRDTMFVALLC